MEGLAAKLKFGKWEMLDQVAIARNLTEATTLVAKALEQAGHPERVKDTFELIEANECVVALENLCSNLHEFLCPVPQRAYELLEETGSAMRVDRKCWELLKFQVVSQVE